jgi:hypothetical protein
MHGIVMKKVNTSTHLNCLPFCNVTAMTRGPRSSVGITTDYGLEGPGSNRGGDEVFRPSRTTLGPTQPHVQWVPCVSRQL